MKVLMICLLVFAGTTVCADTVVATKVLRPNSIVQDGDVRIEKFETPGAYRETSQAIGMEVRNVVYAGRPIKVEDLSVPAVVQRNKSVILVFSSGGLEIQTSGRALGRGAIGDIVQVMNLSSRAIVFGTVMADGSVSVSNE